MTKIAQAITKVAHITTKNLKKQPILQPFRNKNYKIIKKKKNQAGNWQHVRSYYLVGSPVCVPFWTSLYTYEGNAFGSDYRQSTVVQTFLLAFGTNFTNKQKHVISTKIHHFNKIVPPTPHSFCAIYVQLDRIV